MKHILFLLFLILPFCAQSQVITVMMKPKNGVYLVPCKINSYPLDMFFDTGAASVSVSKTVAEQLFKAGILKKDDIKGTRNYIDATGKNTQKQTIQIKDIEIGGIHIKDVEACISPSQNAPLLFGQSAIKKLGKISINGEVLTIIPGEEVRSNICITTFMNVPLGTDKKDVIKELEQKFFYYEELGAFGHPKIAGISFDLGIPFFDNNNKMVSGMYQKIYKPNQIERLENDLQNLYQKLNTKYKDFTIDYEGKWPIFSGGGTYYSINHNEYLNPICVSVKVDKDEYGDIDCYYLLFSYYIMEK